MDSTVKIETDNHDILVLKFNCVLSQEIRDRVSKEIVEEYKTGVVFVPAYMDVYVVKSNKENKTMANENSRYRSNYSDEESDMDEIGTIEIYKSRNTGKMYLEFILDDKKFPNHGEWITTKEIFPDEFKKLENTLLKLKDDEED